MKDKEQEKALEAELEVDINHILESGANDIRLINLFKSYYAKWQQSQQPKPAKSLEECRDKVANKIGRNNWQDFKNLYSNIGSKMIEKAMDEVAELYASQQVEQAVKVALEMAAEKVSHIVDGLTGERIGQQSILSLAPQVLEKLKEDR